ncbi:hypothetical protein L1049_000649 [Liquidambar formosana]|uniref:Alpha-1,3/1,6-mannosyltransferase ALG2 n=1 Tax=Liquidambar formosana TaxID=63359 RepID=A0AAP0NCR2_LIQFO
MDDRGNVYVADTLNLAIRKIGEAGVTTIAGGKSNVAGYRDGPSEHAMFSNDFDLVYVQPTCSLLVVDRGNAALRQISLNQEDCDYQYSSISATGTFPVTVYGAFLPRHIFYRLHAVCAYLRCIFVALCLLFMWPSFDVILADQVGFDNRLKENVEYLEELKLSRKGRSISSGLPSSLPAQRPKEMCFSPKLCVLYTPKDEHFGIVPLEAMAAYKPVIACNSGGPVETIKNGVTGFLCDPTPQEFSLAMAKLIQDPQLAEKMGGQARQHATNSFSTKIFGQRLNRFLVDVARGKRD